MPRTPKIQTWRPPLNRADLRTIYRLIGYSRDQLKSHRYTGEHAQAEVVAALTDLNMLEDKLMPEFRAAGIVEPAGGGE